MQLTRLLVAAIVVMTIGGLVTWGAASDAGPGRARLTQDRASSGAERELRDDATGEVTVRRGERGIVRLLGTQIEEDLPAPDSADDGPPKEVAAKFLARYDALWALDNEGAAAKVTRTRRSATGAPIVRFQQTVDGMPVFGANLAVALDQQGDLESVSGKTTPLTLPPEKPTVSQGAARRAALTVAAEEAGVSRSTLSITTPEAYVYDPALIGARDVPGLSQVWRLEVRGRSNIRHVVLVDRVSGEIDLEYNQVPHADRVVCDRNLARETSTTNTSCTTTTATRTEGVAPTGVADTDAAYQYAGDTASFFENRAGVASLTDLIGSDDSGESGGKRLRSTVRYCPPVSTQAVCDASHPYRNAFWNGRGVYYGQGYPIADDVVAHELAHGVTQHTSGLAYVYQSGAINESMSDVFGELVDLTNGSDAGLSRPWLIGEDTVGGWIRNMADPTVRKAPDRMTSPYYRTDVWRRDNGGVHTNSGVGNKAAYLIAEPGTRTFNGQTITGLGYGKAAKIYFSAEEMLPSGADYEDLYNVLPQACRDLAATGDAVSADDCPTVTQAVTATEMNLQPESADAAAPEAPVGCTGYAKQDLFFDGFENYTGNWSITSRMWGRMTGYARTGTVSFYGKEPDIANGDPATTYATLNPTFAVPGDVPAYLRFDHVYGLAYQPGSATTPPVYRAGARLEYRVGSGSWQSASGLPWDNGPDRTIEPDSGSSYSGFGGDSHGYVSSRLDLSSLAGKTVQFRWRIDGYPGSRLDGWTLDDVNLYTCDAPSEPRSVTATGEPGTATVRWTPPEASGQNGLTGYTVAVSPGDRVIDSIPATATSEVVDGLADGISYTFTVNARSGTYEGPAATTRLSGVEITGAVSPAVMTYGSTTKISGRATGVDTGIGQPGWQLALMSREEGTTTWQDVTTTTTGSDGGYAFSVEPPTNREFQVRYDSGNTDYLGATSAMAAATVRQRVAGWLSDATVASGTTVRFRGAVAPNHAGQRILLQRRYDGSWHTIARTTLNSDSRYAFPVRRDRAGTYVYRTSTPGHLDHATGISPIRKLTVG